MLSVVVKHQRLSYTLAFVVATPNTNRVDVSPVALWLRVDERISIHLRRRGEEDSVLRDKHNV